MVATWLDRQDTTGGSLDIAEAGQVILRLAHGLAAAIWLGGGAYYLLAVRPNVRSRDDDEARELAAAVQREFGEWASVATIIMLASGVILMFERLSGGAGTAVYVGLLAVKIAAAVAAFWMTGALRPRGGRPSRSRRTGKLDRAWVILGLGTVAFLLGALLTTIYPADIV
jgi:putative copper export protein